MSRLISKLRSVLLFLWGIVASPWRLLQSIRRSMTGASVSVLLIGIITLNIVWGYPWTGMFAAAVSLLSVGWGVNRLMQPRLRIGFSLPTSSPAGEVFTAVTHLQNRSWLPAIDLLVRLGGSRSGRAATGRAEKRGTGEFELLSPARPLEIIHPNEHVDLGLSVRFDRRGIHVLPELVVVSTFPFHLFRCVKRIPSNAQMAITPRPISGEEDAFSREMLSALGGWSHKLLAGDAMDYTGSREYQQGMPVRRWDFASWARLGRPIVREFQSPSIQAVTVIVDTAASQVDESRGETFERLLSIAAMAINELARKLVVVRLYVGNEDPDVITDLDLGGGRGGDCESLLIRLAAAEISLVTESDRRMEIVLEHVSKLPVVVLTLRPDAEVWQQVPPTVTVLRVDPGHASVVPAPGASMPAPGERSAVSRSVAESSAAPIEGR